MNRGALDARHTCFGLPPGAQSSPTAGPLEGIFRAEGALSSRCITTDYSPMILECPRDAHRGRSERYLHVLETHKVALNRHGSRPWIVLVGEGAVDRGGRAYGGSIAVRLTPDTPVLGSFLEPNRARLRARSKEFQITTREPRNGSTTRHKQYEEQRHQLNRSERYRSIA